MRIMQSTPWLVCPQPAPQANTRLFCFPYAGGSAAVFAPWARSVARSLELWSVQLPGRHERLMDEPYTNLQCLVSDLATAIVPYLDRRFVFFGHSMGATIAFELAHELHRRHGLQPASLIVSGQRAPQLPPNHPPTHNLPTAAFVAELQRLNGTPVEVLANPELLELLLPVLRADFAVCETYTYQGAPPLQCPLTVFGGLTDPDVNRSALEAWREHTTATFRIRMFPGDHFFLHSARPLVLQMLLRDIDAATVRIAA